MDIKRALKLRPATCNDSFAPRRRRFTDAAQPPPDRLIRKPDSLFLQQSRRRHKPVHEDNLRAKLRLMLFEPRLCCPRQFQQMELLGSALERQGD